MRTIFLLILSCLCCRGAISFNGTSFATVLDSASLNFTNSISFHCTARKLGNTAVNQYFVFGKGTSAYNYGADFNTVGNEYAFDFNWNSPELFNQVYGESITPGTATNTWNSVGFNHNWGSDNRIYYNKGAIPAISCVAGGCVRISLILAEPLEIAKGRGGFAKWNGEIGEIAIWNTNLTSRQLQILSGSKIKGIARQIRQTNLVLHLTMDHFAAGTSLAGTNIIRDYSGQNNHASPITNPLAYPESYASYYPNE